MALTVDPAVTRLVPLGELHPWDRNPRAITPERFDALKRALVADPEMLWDRPLVANRDGAVLMGNMRLRAARELGWSDIPARVVDVPEHVAAARALRDNNPFGDWTDDLPPMLLELDAAGLDLSTLGFVDADLDAWLAPEVAAEEEGGAPGRPANPDSKVGDVFELGAHRLVVGDATDPGAWEVLLQGDEAVPLMVTDPPYGVDYDPSWRMPWQVAPDRNTRGRIENDELPADWRRALAFAPVVVAYVWHPGMRDLSLRAAEAVAAAGFEIRQQIVWVKPHAPMSRAAYHWQHECAWYAVKRGASAHWLGDHTQTTVWEAASPIGAYGAASDEERTDHATQKPLVLYERPIVNHVARGGLVVDPFAGSGTACIAAERTGRAARMIELDPAFADVIRSRWARAADAPDLDPLAA